MMSQCDKRADWWGLGPKPFEVTGERESRYHYRIKLFGPIESAEQFSDALEIFDRATPDDRITIYLSSPGGSLDATDTFLQGMHNCAAPVHVVASGGCHSAATVILLNAPSFNLSDSFNALVHNGSTGGYGKASDFKAESKFTVQYMDSFVRKTYAGFLSEDEIEALIDGKDFWMGPKEFCERYERRNELYMEDRHAEGVAELEGAAEELSNLIESVKAKAPKPARRKKATD